MDVRVAAQGFSKEVEDLPGAVRDIRVDLARLAK